MPYQKKNLLTIQIKEKFYWKKLEKNIKKYQEGILNKILIMTMENCWTSSKPINGLRHFVLVNEMREKGNVNLLLVSVLDSGINLKITKAELINNGNWYEGWINLPKIESITEEYYNFKSNIKSDGKEEIFVNEDSLFNIS